MDSLFQEKLGSEEMLDATEDRLEKAHAILEELLQTGDPEPFEQSYDFWAEQLKPVGKDALQVLTLAANETEDALEAGQPSHFNALLCYMLMDWAAGKLERAANKALEPEEAHRLGTFRTAFVSGWQYLLALQAQVRED